MKIYKILGKRGRITIPYELRIRLGFKYNDVVSFEEQDDVITIRREKLCHDCHTSETIQTEKPTDELTLLEFLDELSPYEQRAVLIHLSEKWAHLQKKSVYSKPGGNR